MARQADGEVLCFLCEWFDNHAQLQRLYQLKYFSDQNEIEMFDMKSRRVFLKKSPRPEGLELKDMYLGSQVVIHSRTLTVKEYGDVYTRQKLESHRQKTILIIKPDALDYVGQIIDLVERDGFSIAKMQMVKLTQDQAREVFSRTQDGGYFDSLVRHATSNTSVVVEIVGENAVSRVVAMLPQFRAQFGTNDVENAVHAPETELEAMDTARIFFSPGVRLAPTAVFDSCTCFVIKPHAVRAGLSGSIIDAVLRSGFEISAMILYALDRAAAGEFLEVYQGVVPHFSDMVAELAAGPCIAMELRAAGAVERARELAGPWDVEMAKDLRPETIRGRFGVDHIKNVVHCTDLDEDAILECQYFFDILASRLSS